MDCFLSEFGGKGYKTNTISQILHLKSRTVLKLLKLI